MILVIKNINSQRREKHLQKISIGTRHRVNIGVTAEQTKITEITDISEFKYDLRLLTSSSSTV